MLQKCIAVSLLSYIPTVPTVRDHSSHVVFPKNAFPQHLGVQLSVRHGVNGRIGVVALAMVPLRLPPSCIGLFVCYLYDHVVMLYLKNLCDLSGSSFMFCFDI